MSLSQLDQQKQKTYSTGLSRLSYSLCLVFVVVILASMVFGNQAVSAQTKFSGFYAPISFDILLSDTGDFQKSLAVNKEKNHAVTSDVSVAARNFVKPAAFSSSKEVNSLTKLGDLPAEGALHQLKKEFSLSNTVLCGKDDKSCGAKTRARPTSSLTSRLNPGPDVPLGKLKLSRLDRWGSSGVSSSTSLTVSLNVLSGSSENSELFSGSFRKLRDGLDISKLLNSSLLASGSQKPKHATSDGSEGSAQGELIVENTSKLDITSSAGTSPGTYLEGGYSTHDAGLVRLNSFADKPEFTVFLSWQADQMTEMNLQQDKFVAASLGAKQPNSDFNNSAKKDDLKTPVNSEDLTNLDSNLSFKIDSKGFDGSSNINLDELLSSAHLKLPETRRSLASLSLSSSTRQIRNTSSVAASRDEVFSTLYDMQNGPKKYVLEQNYDASLSNINIQFIDERSDLINKKIYPATKMTVDIVGSDLVTTTDSTGFIYLSELAASSDSLLLSGDKDGRYKRMIHEIRTRDSFNSGVTRLKVIRSFSFDMWTRMAGVVEDMRYGQICGQVFAENTLDYAGFEITIDAESDGIYYFNELGYLDRRLAQTSTNGKFCIFNVDPGEYRLTAFSPESDELNQTQMVSVEPGFLTYTELFEERLEAVIRFAVAGSAYEQLSNDPAIKTKLSADIDYLALTLIEKSQRLDYLDSGALFMNNLNRDPNGVFHVSVDAFELEPTLMRLDQIFAEGEYIVPFYPRGFIEDLALMNDISYDSSAGSIVIEHGLLNGQDGNDIKVEVFTSLGRSVAGVKYIDDAPILKAALFNVKPARYVVVIRDKAGEFLSSQIAHVLTSTMTVVKSGRMYVKNSSER